MSRSRRWRVAALLAAVSVVAVACGDDDDDDTADTADVGDTATTDGGSSDTEAPADGADGGTFVDLGTFVGDFSEHLDPALNSTLDGYQVINALYDGLTDIDTSDPANTTIVPHVAESVTPNDDASVWTFVIRENAQFSDGEPILPSSFQRAWERASDPDFAGDYSYLFNFLEGGAEKLAGEADTISGIAVDDATRTLTVTLAEPYSGFDAVAGFQLFFPMPSAVDELADQLDWENGLMIGNGPFMLEEPRNDQEIRLVPNPNWQGDIHGNTEVHLDRIIFRRTDDPDTAYNAFEAGEGHNANIPPGRVEEANTNYATTLDIALSGTYYYSINQEDPLVGGPENVLLRHAISSAIDRDTINAAVYDGSRTSATGLLPPGIPGFVENMCEYCSYDPEGATALFEEWQDAGNSLSEPIGIQFNIGAGHEDVVQIILDNLNSIGIDAVADGRDQETYFGSLAEGGCVFCRAGWYADYPTADNFLYDLFHSDSAGGGNNYAQYSNPDYDALVDEAKRTTDPETAADLYNQAERLLLDDGYVVPINFYRGDYVYDPERVASFPQSAMGIVLFEQVALAE